MNHLQYYKRYESCKAYDKDTCPHCVEPITPNNCDYTTTDDYTESYVCNDCQEHLKRQEAHDKEQYKDFEPKEPTPHDPYAHRR